MIGHGCCPVRQSRRAKARASSKSWFARPRWLSEVTKLREVVVVPHSTTPRHSATDSCIVSPSMWESKSSEVIRRPALCERSEAHTPSRKLGWVALDTNDHSGHQGRSYPSRWGRGYLVASPFGPIAQLGER